MIDDMRNVLTDARNAIASLPMETLGYASDPMGEQIHWPIRDELLHRMDEALRRPAQRSPMRADIAQSIDRLEGTFLLIGFFMIGAMIGCAL